MSAAVDVKMQKLRACADRALLCASFAITSKLTIRTRVWSGGKVGAGVATDTDFVLPQKYPIREVTTREILASGGRINKGDVMVQQVVPAFPAIGANLSGGLTRQQLCPDESFPAVQTGTEVIYIIEGDISGYFTRSSLNATDPVFWTLLLTRTRNRARQGDAL